LVELVLIQEIITAIFSCIHLGKSHLPWYYDKGSPSTSLSWKYGQSWWLHPWRIW